MLDIPIRVEEMQRHLKEKYGETFLPRSGVGAGINHNFAEVVFAPESRPEVRLRIYDHGDRFADDYFGTLVKESFRAMLTDAFGREEAGVKVFFSFTASAYPEKYTRPEQLPEALRETPIAFYAPTDVLIRADAAYDRARWDAACETLRRAGVTGLFRGWRVPEDAFARAEEAGYREILKAQDPGAPVFRNVI